MSDNITQSAYCELCDDEIKLANFGLLPGLCLKCSGDVLRGMAELKEGKVVEYEV